MFSAQDSEETGSGLLSVLFLSQAEREEKKDDKAGFQNLLVTTRLRNETREAVTQERMRA